MSEPVISVDGLAKAYRIWEKPAARLTSPLWAKAARAAPGSAADFCRRRAAAHYRDFYALQDVSFALQRGESVGIIGRNGSGKSTLLQTIAGTLQPTRGRVDVRGRVAALLELGAGFSPEFTGRENVFLNAAVLGLPRREIEQRFDAIAAFAEIGDYLDQPVKTYSSGMVVRLAFAVVAHVDADVLIVDEALAVGDARFQLKCARALERFRAQGTTLLFVSHDTSLVKRLCRRALLLEKGRLVYSGAPNTAVNLYSRLLVDGGGDFAAALQQAEADASAVAVTPRDGPPPDARSAALLADERNNEQLTGAEFTYGGEHGAIRRPTVRATADGTVKRVFATGEAVVLEFDAAATRDVLEPIYAMTIKSTGGQEVYGTNTLFAGTPAPAILAGQTHRVRFAFDLNLIAGTYFVSLGWTYFAGDELNVVQRRYDVLQLEITSGDRAFGIANLRAKIDVAPATA